MELSCPTYPGICRRLAQDIAGFGSESPASQETPAPCKPGRLVKLHATHVGKTALINYFHLILPSLSCLKEGKHKTGKKKNNSGWELLENRAKLWALQFRGREWDGSRGGMGWSLHYHQEGSAPRGRCGHPSEASVTLSRHWKFLGSRKGQIIHEAYISAEIPRLFIGKISSLLGGEGKRAFLPLLLLLLPVSKQLGRELYSIPFPGPWSPCLWLTRQRSVPRWHHQGLTLGSCRQPLPRVPLTCAMTGTQGPWGICLSC